MSRSSLRPIPRVVHWRALVVAVALAGALTSAACGVDCRSDVEVTDMDLLRSAANCGRIDGNLTIGPSDIEAIDTLSGLRGVGGDLRVVDNPLLKDFDGFIDLLAIGGSLEVRGNGALRDVGALTNLDEIPGGLLLDDNPELFVLAGLRSVSRIGGDVLLEGNDSLENLRGLEELATIDGALSIESNAILDDLSHLASLTAVGGPVTIKDNPTLPACSAQAVVDGLSETPDSVELSGNDGEGGC
jgi:hypothetical protein